MGKIRALVSCQNQGCAEEQTFHLDMVKMWKGQPLCEGCFDMDGEYWLDAVGGWGSLPDIRLEDLYA